MVSSKKIRTHDLKLRDGRKSGGDGDNGNQMKREIGESRNNINNNNY